MTCCARLLISLFPCIQIKVAAQNMFEVYRLVIHDYMQFDSNLPVFQRYRAEQKLPPCSWAPSDGDNMSSGMLVDRCETKSHHIPENGELHTHHSENLKCSWKYRIAIAFSKKSPIKFLSEGILNMLYVSFWVIPQRLNFMCRHFGALCLFHLHRQVGK